jgi:hypothetical protein
MLIGYWSFFLLGQAKSFLQPNFPHPETLNIPASESEKED